VRRGAVRPPIARRRRAVSIARPAPRIGGRARVVAVGATGRSRPALAAGRNWTCRTAKAESEERSGHTSVVDAAGAIYIIGGSTDVPCFQDVWASTDGGARAGLSLGMVGEGTKGVLRGSIGVLRSTRGVLRGTEGVLEGNAGTGGVLEGRLGT
jgi:hypothetical protein